MVVHHRTAGHVDVYVLAVFAVTLVATAVAAVLSEDVALKLQVEQCPVVVVATQVDATAVTAVATVGSAVRVVLHVSEVHGASAALARATIYLYIVYEIRFCHCLYLCFIDE